MKSNRHSRGKRIRPTFFVFCEGETEEAYVKYLRRKYRLPIEIDTSVAGVGITTAHIMRYKKGKITVPKDRDYVIYDLDRGDILNRLESIKGVTVIGSNPCIELWFLLHFADQKSVISSSDCLKALKSKIPSYKKGKVLCKELLQGLEREAHIALERAGKMHPKDNPSTEIPVLIRDLENEINRK